MIEQSQDLYERGRCVHIQGSGFRGVILGVTADGLYRVRVLGGLDDEGGEPLFLDLPRSAILPLDLYHDLMEDEDPSSGVILWLTAAVCAGGIGWALWSHPAPLTLLQADSAPILAALAAGVVFGFWRLWRVAR